MLLSALAACSGTRATGSNPAGISWVEVPAGQGAPAFRVARSPVTNAQYARCAAAGACTPPRSYGEKFSAPDQPAVGVTWEQARAFSAWAGGRLPTGAEWDRAALGGGKGPHPWGAAPIDCKRAILLDRAAGGAGCGRGSTWPVCSRPTGRTPHGACDMGGHVYEWVADSPAGEPGKRALRGRPWDEPAQALELSPAEKPDAEYDYLGFRPVR